MHGPAEIPSSTSGPRRPGKRTARPAGLVAGVALGAAIVALAVATTHGYVWGRDGDPPASVVRATDRTALWQRPAVSAQGLVRRTGVRVAQVAVTGDGGLIDLRYQVVDPDRASSVHDDETPPALISESSGVVVDQLLMGHQHEGTLLGGQTYYLIFSNPGNLVASGSSVTVLLGDASVRHVLVR